MRQVFHELKVLDIIQETPDTVSICFDVPESLSEIFSFIPGQYITLRRENTNGQEIRRAYSICSCAALGEPLTIAVKRVPKGKMSTYLTQDLQMGDVLSVMPPEGMFTLSPDASRQHTYYMMAAGSGITPIIAMIKAVLEEEPLSHIHLLYGSRTEKDIIFHSQLDELSKRYSGQFDIDYVLSGLSSGWFQRLFSRASETTIGNPGRVDGDRMSTWLAERKAKTETSSYYICGPGKMNRSLQDKLQARGIPQTNIHLEYFGNEGMDTEDITALSVEASIEVQLDGQEFEVPVSSSQTILQAIQAAGHDPPYSCLSGACSSCVAKLTKGSVSMEVCLALDSEEIEDGYILTCQAHPLEPSVGITYDV